MEKKPCVTCSTPTANIIVVKDTKSGETQRHHMCSECFKLTPSHIRKLELIKS